ncbi:AfsR/SARP family transcriptional regulator [Streptomyces sp. AP-93]|uniref:AfsR/SARP family transcriptional regulator n=1 Tax=Streptomyces sp. AP-93 TaxID=2929048 RepID=UPI001FAE8611|nr:AfsR/SARP family transcriptional regulator [Streptomyces sp. AP-93]MCJ0871774.1 NB-ARC domain-containing protein [Streptomyces sp. AP-93]
MSGTKVQTVLAALLLARGRVVSDSRLIALLWGWDPPATMHAQIYTYVSRLRKLLGPDVELVRRQPGYLLDLGGARVDAVEFERLGRTGREALRDGRHEQAADLLRDALELWQGPALANVTTHLAEAELPQLEEARAAVLEHRIEADLELGRHRQLAAELTGLVSEFPLRERLRAQLMTALYRCGRQADALRAYHQGRSVLADELGVDPGAILTSTYHAVLNSELDQVRVPAQAVRTARPDVPAMLPPDVADFSGRTGQLADLCSRLGAAGAEGRSAFQPRRLLLTGMAGVGKTALAVRAAHACRESFPDGQLYAELSHPDGSPKDPAKILLQLLRALGEPSAVAGGPGSDDMDELASRYRARTAGKRLLVLLDNAASDLQLVPLLPTGPEAAVLVTGRSSLAAVNGSHTMTVVPMDEADSLGVLAAVAGHERISAEPAAARELASHCAGLPLALRIVGARLVARPHWPAARLAHRLANPATRLHELRFGDLDVRRDLAACVWRLGEISRALLPELSVLGAHSFPALSAAAVIDVPERLTEEVLEELVDVSLMDMAGIDTCGRPRYRFHPLVQLFAASMTGTHGAAPTPHDPVPVPVPGPVRARLTGPRGARYQQRDLAG